MLGFQTFSAVAWIYFLVRELRSCKLSDLGGGGGIKVKEMGK